MNDELRPKVKIQLDDGEIYVTVVVADSYTPRDIARAGGEALGLFLRGYERDHLKLGDSE